MAKQRPRRARMLRGTPEEHASEAQSFYNSARKNFRQRENSPPRSSCHVIEHFTDVVAEAHVAAVAAYHAGDTELARRAEQLMTDATHRQRDAVAACRRRERALTKQQQPGNYRPRGR